MPDDDFLPHSLAEREKVQYILQRDADVRTVARIVREFQITQHRVGVGQQRLHAGIRPHTGRIQRGADGDLMQRPEQLRRPAPLHQRFAARKRHASARRVEIAAVARNAGNQLLHGVFGASRHALRVGVVAPRAVVGAALQKDHVPQSRPVHRAQTLKRMYLQHHANLLGVMENLGGGKERPRREGPP